ncbi:MAG TPA: trypsin-like peptidase domain-containing protein [Isosphaeraceae bacterium]|nr:trypsin-like peptidase domain-containing protein [Isosphaeraceae bacterium]
MPRPASTPLGYLLVLALGVGLGFSFQVPAVRPLEAQVPPPAPSAVPPSPAPGSDEAIYQQLAKQYDQFQSVDRTFQMVARAVGPAVVHIVARKHGQDQDGSPARFDETGSGVIVSPDGTSARYVLTNNHVVEGARAEDVTIHLQDGRVLRPELYWADFKVDIAVLKLDRTDLPAARLGDSDQVAVGQWVLALGSPFGLMHSVSQGIISARGRYEPELEQDGVENQDFLQTDAAINPGNSGGPLVNLKGEVIGLNTAIASNGGGSEGVGFSIPINLARWAMKQLIVTGRVSRGAIGVILQELLPRDALSLGLDRPRGARVGTVQDDSPAALAGLREGDVILRYNGVEVVDYNHLINMVSTSPIGEPADLVIWRERHSLPLKIVIADRAAVLSKMPQPGRTSPEGLVRRPRGGPDNLTGGLDLLTIADDKAAREHGLNDAIRGVLIVHVDPSNPLSAYLQPNDVVQTIDGRSVRSTDEFWRALEHHPVRTRLNLGLQRTVQGKPESHDIEIP